MTNMIKFILEHIQAILSNGIILKLNHPTPQRCWKICNLGLVSNLYWNLCLSMHPFVPWSTLVFFPSFPFACELVIERWRIEVVEAQVGDSVFPIHRHADRGCLYCNLCFILIEISFTVQ